MHMTVAVNDAPYNEALRFGDPEMNKADLMREAIRTFVRVQVGRRLSAPGGKEPQMPEAPRRPPSEDQR